MQRKIKMVRKQKFVPRLSDEDIDDVCGILDGWTGKLTWEFLIEELLRRWRRTYTRQALDRHRRIKRSFFAAKSRLRNSPVNLKRQGPAELARARDRILRLEAELERANRQIDRFIAKFLRWAYNAQLKGLTEADLDRPLVSIDREPTRGYEVKQSY